MQPGKHLDLSNVSRLHGPALLLFGQAVTGDRGRAQDAVHQVFLKLIEDGSLPRVVDAKAYLFSRLRNTVFNDSKYHLRNVALDTDLAWFATTDRHLAGVAKLQRE